MCLNIQVQREDFCVSQELSRVTSAATSDCGAWQIFLGRVRGQGQQGLIETLSIEAYPSMCETMLSEIASKAVAKYELQAVSVVHRYGTLYPGDNIVLIISAGRKRQLSWQASQYILEYLKTDAPFWKQETYTNGESQWLYPV